MTMNTASTKIRSTGSTMATMTSSSNIDSQRIIHNTIPELLEWNLIDRISPYLDRHMIFPLLDYFEKQIQEAIPDPDDTKATLRRDVNEARYQLLRPTNMVDYMMDVYNQSMDTTTPEAAVAAKDIHEEMTQQKQKVLQDLEALKQRCLPLLEEIDTATRVGVMFFCHLLSGIICCISLMH